MAEIASGFQKVSMNGLLLKIRNRDWIGLETSMTHFRV